MSNAVIKVDRSQANQVNDLTSDEIVSRLSIVTKDSEVLGVPGDCVYVSLSGPAEGIDRAKELFEKQNVGRVVPDDVATQVQDAIKAEEENAAEGMGTLFG